MSVAIMQPLSIESLLLRPQAPLWEPSVTKESLGRIVQTNHIADAPLSAKSKSRKRVRFDDDEEDAARVKVRVLEVLRPSSEMSHEEKGVAWYQKVDYQENVRNVRAAAKFLAYQVRVDSATKTYSEALASTYTSCAIDTFHDEDEIESEQRLDNCAQHLALASSLKNDADNSESTRGLEKLAFPLLGREAVRRRNEAIGAILMARFAVDQSVPAGERQELIRRISEEQSKCARRFAKAMGTADAISALLEYGSTPLLLDHTSSRYTVTSKSA